MISLFPTPVVPEPEPQHLDPLVRDLVGPKLLESTIQIGDFDVDAGLESITLTFDETVAKRGSPSGAKCVSL